MDLPCGRYPFIDQTYDLADMAFSEAPPGLEALLKDQAKTSGIEIVRDAAVELRCQSEEWPEAVFLIYWPRSSERINVLVPKKFAKGLA